MKSFNINFQTTPLQKPKDIPATDIVRLQCEHTTINNLFGNGWLEGAVVHMTGYRGCGKTTLWLQILESFSKNYTTAFLSNEESLDQLKMKCDRLKVENVDIANMNQLEDILEVIKTHKIVVVDCFQGISTDLKEKDLITKLISQAKESKCCLAIIVQMTKNLREKGASEIGHLCDQSIKLMSGVPSYFQMNNPVILDGSTKNRNGKTGYLVLDHGAAGFDFQNPWEMDLVPDLSKLAVKKV